MFVGYDVLPSGLSLNQKEHKCGPVISNQNDTFRFLRRCQESRNCRNCKCVRRIHTSANGTRNGFAPRLHIEGTQTNTYQLLRRDIFNIYPPVRRPGTGCSSAARVKWTTLKHFVIPLVRPTTNGETGRLPASPRSDHPLRHKKNMHCYCHPVEESPDHLQSY